MPEYEEALRIPAVEREKNLLYVIDVFSCRLYSTVNTVKENQCHLFFLPI
jgi:hypothetical protein